MSENEIAALEAKLAELRRAESARLAELAKSVKPVYEFRLELDTRGYDRVFDDACTMYQLNGRVTNKPELEAVGARSHFEGGMRYVFNGATGKFICSVGGGSIFLSSVEGWAELSEFVRRNPEGGDVSEIVSRRRAEEGRQGF